MKLYSLIILIAAVCSCKTPDNTVELQSATPSTSDGYGHSHRIDRMGNVEVTNFLLCFRPISIIGITQPSFIGRQVDFQCPDGQVQILKDSYNSDDAFAVSPAHRALYEKWFRIGFKLLDGMDSDEKPPFDWPHLDTTGSDHPFVGLFVNSDWLLVDTTKPCNTAIGHSSYLDIQMAAYYGNPGGHRTCGGRVPNDDVIDTTLTLFMNGPERLPRGWFGQNSQGVQRGDGVTQAGKVAPTAFPWVAPAR